MRQIIICLMLLVLSGISLGQPTTPAAVSSKQYYLQKSDQQRKTASILVGGGLVLEVAGIIAYKYGNASLFLLGAGLLSQIVSIPFFVSSAINKGKSKKASLSFNFGKTRDIHMAINSGAQPKISLKINL